MEEKEIRITVSAPIPCTEEEFEEWIKFELGYNGGMSSENPLAGYDLQVTDINY